MTEKQSRTKIAVAYCRYSSENQEDGQSIAAQKRAIQNYADNEGVLIKEWYTDEAYSATTDKRPAFQKMLADSKARDFNLVLVHKLDRFARNKYDSAIHKKELLKRGIKVFSVLERIDNTPEGKIMEGLLEGMAEYYSANLAREVLKGLKENAYKGYSNGGKTPYGYKRVPKVDTSGNMLINKRGYSFSDTVLDPVNAEAVKIIFNMTLDGYKRCEIIDRLHSLGYKNSESKEFIGTYIDRILRNERYTGTYIYTIKRSKWGFNDEEEPIKVEDKLPQIISREVFEAVQQILKQRVHRPPSNTEENYLLSGKIYCGECGSVFSGARQHKGGKKYVFYKCNWNANYKNGRKVVDYCHNNTVRKEDLEDYVLKQVYKVIFNESLIDDVINEYNDYAAEVKSNIELIDMYENKIKDIDKQTANIVMAVSMTGNFGEALQQKLASLEDEKRQIQDIIKQEKQGNAILPLTKDELRRVYKKAQDILLNGSFEQRKTVLQWFVNKVVVFKQNVEIFVNILPMVLCGGIDLEVTAQDFLAKITTNEYQNSEKDGDEPSFPLDFVVFPNDNFHRENLIGEL